MEGAYLISIKSPRRIGARRIIVPEQLGLTLIDKDRRVIKSKTITFDKFNFNAGANVTLIKAAIANWNKKIPEIIKFMDMPRKCIYERKMDMLLFCSMMTECNQYRSYFKMNAMWLELTSRDYSTTVYTQSIADRTKTNLEVLRQYSNDEIHRKIAHNQNRLDSTRVKLANEVMNIEMANFERIYKDMQDVADKLGLIMVNKGNKRVEIISLSGTYSIDLMYRPSKIMKIHYKSWFDGDIAYIKVAENIYSPIDALIEIYKMSTEAGNNKFDILKAYKEGYNGEASMA